MTLDLVNQNKSDLKYEIVRYPDGQVSFILKDNWFPGDQPPIDRIQIKSRLNSYTDLMIILAANDVLRKEFVLHLYCPYIFGSRSDRRFQPGQSFDLKIICDILKSCNFKSIEIVDPHSDVLPALLESPETEVIIDYQADWIYERIPAEFFEGKILISPDAGAYKKIFKLGERLDLPIIPCNKFRDLEGNIFLSLTEKDVFLQECIIVDDICDGGKTFIDLSEKLLDIGAKAVDLIVTHGIFSKGYELGRIRNIWTTNSIQDHSKAPINVFVTNLFK